MFYFRVALFEPYIDSLPCKTKSTLALYAEKNFVSLLALIANPDPAIGASVINLYLILLPYLSPDSCDQILGAADMFLVGGFKTTCN